jgi:hypothetical protein
MKPGINIEKHIKNIYVESLPATTSAELDKRVLSNVMEALEESKNKKPSTIQPNIWRIIIRSRITKLATAAMIIIAVIVSVHHFSTSTDRTSAVYAAAIEALQNVNTVHISGWTTCLHPSVDDASMDTSKRYATEKWEWITNDGEYRVYDKRGPLTVWDDGYRNYEYNENNNLLNIRKSFAHIAAKDIERFQSVTSRLNKLKDRGIKVTEIGTRTINDKEAKGFRVERDNKREDIWLDVQTNLMLENNAHIFQEGQWTRWRYSILTYNQNVPVDIRSYVPPHTEGVEYSWDIDPRFEKWHLHLRKIAAYYRQHPLPETMELLPRESDEKIEAYLPGRLPDIDAAGHWVLPIQSSLGAFLRTRIKPSGSLRVSKDLQKIELNHDLITSNKFTQRQRVDFVLDALGLEIIEITEQRKVWIAHYDGRPLKPWQEVTAPVARGNARATGPGMASNKGAYSMKQLFDDFIYWQDYDLSARKIIIVDETGMPSEPAEGQSRKSVAVSSQSPYWGGNESIEIARKWFKEQFGVTFTEEIRAITVYEVRKRE